ncbi:ABC transporter ATP-binding protein [Pseudochelatococcus sp. B33]
MLHVSDLCVSYSGIQALKSVSLDVSEGEIFALIGPNGAGKSTLLNAICGVVAAQSGSVRFLDCEILGRPAFRIARSGLLQVPEGRQVVAPLSVLENLELGRIAAADRAGGRDEIDHVYELFPILAQRRYQISGTLSGGQQQMLAIGRALMGRPRLLLLDEPSLGLAPVVVGEVFQALRRLSREGLTIFLVEQNARLALQTAHRAAVLEQGRVVMTGKASDLADDPLVADHYFGRTKEIA